MKESKYVTIYKEWKEKNRKRSDRRRRTAAYRKQSDGKLSGFPGYCPQVPEFTGAERIYSERKRTGIAGNAKTEVYVPLSEIASFQEVNKLSYAHAETEVVNLDILQDSHKIKKNFSAECKRRGL